MSGVDAKLIKHLPAIQDSKPFDLNLHLRAGPGINVIAGPSGSGKTLALNCIGGFLRPDSGRILINDQLYFDADASVHLPPEQRRCGYIFQDHALFPHMTVRDNLRFSASLASSRAGRLARHRRIAELLESFELTELAERKPAHLSGGQKQRAAIARVLVAEPRILLLDEPARGLDARLRRAFYQLLRSKVELAAIPVLLVSHDLEDCFEIADGVALIDNGALLQWGTRDEVLSKPLSVEVARSLGVFNIAPAEIRMLNPAANSSRIWIGDQEIEGPYFPGHLIGDGGFACIRRSEIKVAPELIKKPNSQLVLTLESHTPTSQGVRLSFRNGFTVNVSQTIYEELCRNDCLALEFPAGAVSFVGK